MKPQATYTRRKSDDLQFQPLKMLGICLIFVFSGITLACLYWLVYILAVIAETM